MNLAVGIPKELKTGERRVSLTPKGVQYLHDQGITVYVEKSAGVLSGFSDDEYAQAGAVVVPDAAALWSKAGLIKKVKEPIEPEFKFFTPHHLIFTYLHLASPSAASLIAALKKSKTTAIGYETIEKNGEEPLLKPMSEIAGVLAAYYGAIFKSQIRISGTVLTGVAGAKSMIMETASAYPAVPKLRYEGSLLILGGGYVGRGAAEMAAQMGADIEISEISDRRRKELSVHFKSKNLKISVLDPADTASYLNVLSLADVIIGAVHSAGKRAPLVIDEQLLEKISRVKKKIILDVSIDQGGNIAESRPCSYDDLLYLDSFQNIRFSVANIPSVCGKGASLALEAGSLEYAYHLACGLEHAVDVFPELKSGINVLHGEVVHHAIIEAHSL